MISSWTSVYPEQAPHPSLGTSSSRPESWHTISLDRVSSYHWYLGERAHPVLQWSLHNSLENSPDQTGGSVFSLTCTHQFCGNCPLTFFLIWVFFHAHSRFTGQQGKEEGIYLTPLYHFHPLHRYLDISRVITAEGSPLT